MSRVQFGNLVNKEQSEILSRAPTPEDIFENMNNFNEEIEDTIRMSAEENIPLEKEIKPVKRELKPRVNIKNITPSKSSSENIDTLKIQSKREIMPEKSLQEDLASFEKTITPAEPTPQELAELSQKRIRQALDKLGGPSEKQINAWKAEAGKDSVHITIFSEDEMYIYTHLTRAMWQQVQKMLDKMRETKDSVKEEELRELVVKHCVKWPLLSAEWKYNSRAGVVDSLFESIWYHSYFFTPQQVQSLTTQL